MKLEFQLCDFGLGLFNLRIKLTTLIALDFSLSLAIEVNLFQVYLRALTILPF